MGAYTDSLNVIMNFEANQAIASINSVKDSLNSMFQAMQQGKTAAMNARFMGEELSKAGMRVETLNNKTGEMGNIYDKVTGKSVMFEDALMRVNQRQMDQIRMNTEGASRTEAMNKKWDNSYTSVMKTSNILPRTTARFRELGNVMQKVGKASRGDMMKYMGLGFAFMFIGMAIKKTVKAALNAISETYKTATGEQSEYNQQMNKLGAAFEFFKFSLMDALASTGVFEILINMVISVINWFAKLPAHWRTFIMIALAALFVAASISAIAGQLLLLRASGKANLVIFFKLFFMMWISIFLIIGAIYLLVQVWSSETLTMHEKIFLTIVIVLVLVAAIILVGWALGLWKGAALAAADSIFSAIAMVLMILIAIGLAYLAIKAIWTNVSLSVVSKILLTIAVLALLAIAIIGILALFGIIPAAVFLVPLAIIAAIALILAVIWMFKDAIWKFLKALFKAFIELLVGLFKSWLNTWKAILTLVWDVIKALFKIFINFWVWLGAWLVIIYLNWVLVWMKIGQAIVNAIMTAMVWVAKKIDDVINGIIKQINKFLPKEWKIKFTSDISGAMQKAKDKMSDVFGIAKTEKSIEVATKIKDDAAKNMGEGLDDIGKAGKEFVNSMVKNGKETFDVISKSFNDIKGAFKDFGEDIKERAGEIKEGFKKKTGGVTGAAEQISGQSFFGQDPNTFTSQMPGMPTGTEQASNLDAQKWFTDQISINTDQLTEQFATNDKLDTLIEQQEDGIKIVEMPEIGKFEYGGVNLEDGMEDMNSQYNGSTTS